MRVLTNRRFVRNVLKEGISAIQEGENAAYGLFSCRHAHFRRRCNCGLQDCVSPQQCRSPLLLRSISS